VAPKSQRGITILLDAAGTVASVRPAGSASRHYNLRREAPEMIAAVVTLADDAGGAFTIQTFFLSPVATCLAAAIRQRVSKNTRVTVNVVTARKQSMEFEFASGGWLSTQLSLEALAFPDQRHPPCRPRVTGRKNSRKARRKSTSRSAKGPRSSAQSRGVNDLDRREKTLRSATGGEREPDGTGGRSTSRKSKSYKARVKREKARRARARYAGRPVRGIITVWNRRKR
jgi:hypothetical protein